MRFKPLYVDPGRYFAVGMDEDSGQPMIEIASIGPFGANLYFRITPEELLSFRDDPHSLDDLAERLAHDKGVRFYSERIVQ
jgi:hypothetical protein